MRFLLVFLDMSSQFYCLAEEVKTYWSVSRPSLRLFDQNLQDQLNFVGPIIFIGRFCLYISNHDFYILCFIFYVFKKGLGRAFSDNLVIIQLLFLLTGGSGILISR